MNTHEKVSLCLTVQAFTFGFLLGEIVPLVGVFAMMFVYSLVGKRGKAMILGFIAVSSAVQVGQEWSKAGTLVEGVAVFRLQRVWLAKIQSRIDNGEASYLTHEQAQAWKLSSIEKAPETVNTVYINSAPKIILASTVSACLMFHMLAYVLDKLFNLHQRLRFYPRMREV